MSDLCILSFVLQVTCLSLLKPMRPFSLKIVIFALTTLIAAWRPRCGVSFEELDSNLFLICFDHLVDYRRVLEEGPWLFNRNLVVPCEVGGDERPSKVSMNMVTFWVRLVDLPISFRWENIIRQIVQRLGEVIRVETGNLNRVGHVRARVSIDITKPLC